MATVASPYGLRPVNMQGGQGMSHGIRLMKLPAAYATNIFNGDVVKVVAGQIEKEVLLTAIAPIGVFLGCEYEDSAMGLLHRNYWPASTVVKTGTTAWAYIADDPDLLFEVQANGAVAQAGLGQNANLIQSIAGSTANSGKSGLQLSAAIATTATFPLRIVDFVRRPGSVIGDAFTDCIVRINTHLNRAVLGST